MDSVRNQNNLFDDVPVHGDERDSFDRYYTPEWATQALVDYLGDRLHGTVWEPACGADWIGRVLRSSGKISRYLGTDLDPEAKTLDWFKGSSFNTAAWNWDFLERSKKQTDIFNWVITNPPYATPTGSATDFVRAALRYRERVQNEFFTVPGDHKISVAMLMRIGWLEPCADRADILTDNPPTDVLVLPRVHYIGAGKSNNQTSAWYIWNGESGETKMKVVSK